MRPFRMRPPREPKTPTIEEMVFSVEKGWPIKPPPTEAFKHDLEMVRRYWIMCGRSIHALPRKDFSVRQCRMLKVLCHMQEVSHADA